MNSPDEGHARFGVTAWKLRYFDTPNAAQYEEIKDVSSLFTRHLLLG
jgi:hypothetical protein